jgi:hypothetical protein
MKINFLRMGKISELIVSKLLTWTRWMCIRLEVFTDMKILGSGLLGGFQNPENCIYCAEVTK